MGIRLIGNRASGCKMPLLANSLASIIKFSLFMGCLIMLIGPSTQDWSHMVIPPGLVTLEKVCANNVVPIVSVEEALRLAHEAKSTLLASCLEFLDSFTALEKIIGRPDLVELKTKKSTETKRNKLRKSLGANATETATGATTSTARLTHDDIDICGASKFELIKKYHMKYVSALEEAHRQGTLNANKVAKEITSHSLDAEHTSFEVQYDEFKQRILIPISLLVFFKAYALQVSGQCKINFVKNIKLAIDDKFTPEDHDTAEMVWELDPNLRLAKEAAAKRRDSVSGDSDSDYDYESDSESESELGQPTSLSLSSSGDNPASRGHFVDYKSDATDSTADTTANLLGGGGKQIAAANSKTKHRKPKTANSRAKSRATRKRSTKDGSPPLSFHRLVYMPEFEGELVRGDYERLRSITLLNLLDKRNENKFMHACKYRFEPIYSKLVMPIVRLAKLGYDYHGDKIDFVREQLDYGDEEILFKALTKYCERYGRYELIDAAVQPLEEGDGVQEEKTIDYTVKLSSPIVGEMWIRTADELATEIELIRASKASGFARFKWKLANKTRKALSYLDPNRIAWYNRNQNTIGSTLNIVSACASTGGIVVSAVAMG